MKRMKCCEGEMLTGWGMGYGMELLENTEHLTLKPEWMKYTNLQSSIYMGLSIYKWSQSPFGLQYFARRCCTGRVQLIQEDTLSSSGRWMLSRTVGRSRRASPRSLVASCWRPEPFTRRLRALMWLRRLWNAAGDFQYQWRTVFTQNAGSCGGFWRFHLYVYRDVEQCSACKGLSRVCFLSPCG